LIANQSLAQVSAADKAAAESLFLQGLDAMKAGRLTEGCAKLEQSQTIEHAIGTSLYLAECYEKQGRTASAWGLFRDAASEAQARGEGGRAEQGRTRAARLEPRLSRLTITVAERPAGLQVFRGANPVSEALWNVAVPVDPGEHRVTARAPGYVESSQIVLVQGDAANATVVIPTLARDTSAPVEAAGAAAVGQAPGATPASDAGTSGVGDTHRTVGLIVGGAGVVAIGIGAIFGFKAMSKNSDAKDICPNNQCTTEEGVRLTEEAKDAAVVANVLVIGGAAVAATGLVLYLTAPSGQERSVGVVTDGRGGARLTFGGSF
jgi:serine/threonine-protein kinase